MLLRHRSHLFLGDGRGNLGRIRLDLHTYAVWENNRSLLAQRHCSFRIRESFRCLYAISMTDPITDRALGPTGGANVRATSAEAHRSGGGDHDVDRQSEQLYPCRWSDEQPKAVGFVLVLRYELSGYCNTVGSAPVTLATSPLSPCFIGPRALSPRIITRLRSGVSFSTSSTYPSSQTRSSSYATSSSHLILLTIPLRTVIVMLMRRGGGQRPRLAQSRLGGRRGRGV